MNPVTNSKKRNPDAHEMLYAIRDHFETNKTLPEIILNESQIQKKAER